MRRAILLLLLLPLLSGCLMMDEMVYDDESPCMRDPGPGFARPASGVSMQTREPELASPR